MYMNVRQTHLNYEAYYLEIEKVVYFIKNKIKKKRTYE